MHKAAAMYAIVFFFIPIFLGQVLVGQYEIKIVGQSNFFIDSVMIFCCAGQKRADHC